MMRALAAQPARRTPTLPPVDSATRSSIRIAVVDDERTLRESCHSVLQAEGYNVALCGRGAHAVLVARESRVLEEQRAQHPGDGDRIAVLGDSPLFKKAIALARKVAATDASVFLTGESGAGKELFAQFIHDNSRRSS